MAFHIELKVEVFVVANTARGAGDLNLFQVASGPLSVIFTTKGL